MKMNHLINGWECWLMVSRATVSRPIICQKCFGLVAKGNQGENSLQKYLNAFPKPRIYFSYLKEGIILFAQECDLKVLILEFFGINIRVVWSLSHHFGKHLMSLEPKHNLINYSCLGG